MNIFFHLMIVSSCSTGEVLLTCLIWRLWMEPFHVVDVRLEVSDVGVPL